MMWRPSAGGSSPDGKEERTQSSAQRAQPTESDSRPSVSPRRKQKTTKGRKPSVFGLIVVAVIVIALVGGYLFLNRPLSSAIDSGKYQAVFLSNGQVYFGKLQTLNSDYMRLTDIYYLQSQQSATDITQSDNPQDSTDSSVQLIKLGEEIHGPEDEMVFSKEHMLFFENLKSEGNVTRSINQHKNTR